MTGPELDPGAGATLVGLAVAALGAHLTSASYEPDEPDVAALRHPGATFVTLEQRGALRGCVGTVTPSRPLWRDAAHNAVSAAADPRLPRVTPVDWPDLDVHVSVLSPLEPVEATGPDDLVGALRPGVDGLVLADDRRRATFLPVVWAKLDDPVRFVAALLAKGGWLGSGAGGLGPADADGLAAYWPDGLTAQRYTTVEFHDPAPRPPLA